MKRLTTTLILAAVFFTANAYYGSSQLNIRMMDNSYFTVVFNNQVYHQPSNNFVFRDLLPGSYHLKVIRNERHGWNTVQRVVYNGPVNVPEMAVVNAAVSPQNRLRVHIDPIPAPAHTTITCDMHGCTISHGHSHHGGSMNYDYGYFSNPAPAGMHPQQFAELKHSINARSFDNTKLQIAKQAMQHNSISSQQVLELVQLLTFENNKLDLAMYAYNYVIDPQRFYIVNNAFTFESSIRKLDEYIRGS